MKKLKKLSISEKGIGIENATRNQQPSTIEIRRIEKVKGKKVWKQSKKDRRNLMIKKVDRTIILKHFCDPYSDCFQKNLLVILVDAVRIGIANALE